MSEKQEYRNIYKTLRNGLSHHDSDSLSAQICEHILNSSLFRDAGYLYTYYPLGSEADVRLVAQTAWREGKHVAFPRVFGDEMRFFDVKDFGQLAKGAYGILEPVDGCRTVNWLVECVDPDTDGNRDEHAAENGELSGRESGSRLLVLVPGVAFDRQGIRMGRGKGYYDRYFADHMKYTDGEPSFDSHRRITLLGVSYACQIADRLPAESHDLTVPYLVTEEGVVLSGQFCG